MRHVSFPHLPSITIIWPPLTPSPLTQITPTLHATCKSDAVIPTGSAGATIGPCHDRCCCSCCCNLCSCHSACCCCRNCCCYHSKGCLLWNCHQTCLDHRTLDAERSKEGEANTGSDTDYKTFFFALLIARSCWTSTALALATDFDCFTPTSFIESFQ